MRDLCKTVSRGCDDSAGRLLDSAEALPADETDEIDGGDADVYAADEDNPPGPKTTVYFLIPYVFE